jgi:eukaryotic-like serine/threonine-protein kinase
MAAAGAGEALRLPEPATLRLPEPLPVPTAPAATSWRRRRLLAAGLVTLATAIVATLALLLGGLLPVNLGAATDVTPPPGPTFPGPAQPTRVPILIDSLSAPGYWRERQDDTHEVTCSFDDGLVIRSGRAASYRCPGPRDTLSDLAVTVDVTLVEPGSCATVWFRFTIRDGGYALRICEDAYYLVTHGIPESSSVVTLRTYRFDAPLALGQPIRVGIVAEGSRLEFHRDDSVEFTWSSQAFVDGEVALGILQMEHGPPYQVRFANIEILARPH